MGFYTMVPYLNKTNPIYSDIKQVGLQFKAGLEPAYVLTTSRVAMKAGYYLVTGYFCLRVAINRLKHSTATVKVGRVSGNTTTIDTYTSSDAHIMGDLLVWDIIVPAIAHGDEVEEIPTYQTGTLLNAAFNDGYWEDPPSVPPGTHTDNPYEPYGYSSENGGGGSFSASDTYIAPPLRSEIQDLTFLGLGTGYPIKAYIMTKNMLRNFYAAYAGDLIEIFTRMFKDYTDALLGVKVFPLPIQKKMKSDYSAPLEEIIRIWGHDMVSSITGYIPNTQVGIFDFGNIDIPEYFGSYLDYSSTTIKIHLPFIGDKDIDTSLVMGKRIKLRYYYDVFTGDCVAYLIQVNNLHSDNLTGDSIIGVIGAFQGNVAMDIPLISSNEPQQLKKMIAGVAVGVGTMAMGLYQGNKAGEAALDAYNKQKLKPGDEGYKSYSDFMEPVKKWDKVIIGGGATGVGSILSSHFEPKVMNDLNGVSPLVDIKNAYVTVYRPIISVPDNSEHFYGFPSNITMTVGTANGFVKFKDVHLTNLRATEEEKAEIDELLRGGIII